MASLRDGGMRCGALLKKQLLLISRKVESKMQSPRGQTGNHHVDIRAVPNTLIGIGTQAAIIQRTLHKDSSSNKWPPLSSVKLQYREREALR